MHAQLYCINVPIVLDIIPCIKLHTVMSKYVRHHDKYSSVNLGASYIIYTYICGRQLLYNHLEHTTIVPD